MNVGVARDKIQFIMQADADVYWMSSQKGTANNSQSLFVTEMSQTSIEYMLHG